MHLSMLDDDDEAEAEAGDCNNDDRAGAAAATTTTLVNKDFANIRSKLRLTERQEWINVDTSQ